MKKTDRGFKYKEFTDINGEVCTIQKSSLATEDAIWLGCKELKVQKFTDNGWEEMKLGEQCVGTNRMHLSRKQVEKLLPILQKFVQTGEL